MDGKKILFGAHRGDRFHYPENTLLAIKEAGKLGCDVIETDVRMTKDGHLILIHDRDVARTTNGKGFVDEMTLEQIRSLDAGFWKGPEFIGLKIPTVKEFLDYIVTTDLMINWELKEYPADLGEERAFNTIDKLVEMIDAYGLAKRSMINSFSDRDLEYVSDKYGDKFVIHGYIGFSEEIRHFDTSEKPVESFYDWTAIWKKDDNHVAGFNQDYEYAKEHDVLSCILVPDKEEYYKQALDMGCRMFTSDNPEEGIKILKKLGVR